MRRFKLIDVRKRNGKEIKVNEGLYYSSTPSSAAKKAFSRICRIRKMKGKRTFEVSIMETTKGSKNRFYSYHVSRTLLKNPVVRFAGTHKEFEIKYCVRAKSMTVDRERIRKVLKGGNGRENTQIVLPRRSIHKSTVANNMVAYGNEFTLYRKVMDLLDKNGAKEEQKRLFHDMYDSLNEIEIDTKFCCTRKSKLFKVVEKGSAMLNRNQRAMIGTLAKNIRKQMCRDEGIDDEICKMFTKAQMKHEFDELKNRRENVSVQKRNKTDIVHKMSNLVVEVGEASVKAGVPTGVLYTALRIIPREIENFVQLSASLGCQSNQDTTWLSNPLSCRNTLGEVFANSLSSVLVTIGNFSEKATDDVAQFVTLVVFAVLFILFISIGKIVEVNLLGLKIKKR